MEALLSRQAALLQISPTFNVFMLGVGGIGSNLFHMLWSMGVKKLTVMDMDIVGVENTYPGFFHSQYLNFPKVNAVRGWADSFIDNLPAEQKYSTEILNWNLDTAQTMFVGAETLNEYVPNKVFDVAILSTDSFESRLAFWNALPEASAEFKWIIDARMGGATTSVRCVPGTRMYPEQWTMSIKYYYEDLAKLNDADLPCGEKATAPLTKGWIPGMVGKCLWDIIKESQPPFYQRYSISDGFYIKQNLIDGQD